MAEANLFVEKRVHPRISVKIPIKYYFAEVEEGAIENIVEWRLQDKNGQTLDLSLSGMYFAVDQKLIINSVIRLEIPLSDESNLLPIYAEVVWVNEEGAGLHFIEMMDEDVECLKAYLAEVNAGFAPS